MTPASAGPVTHRGQSRPFVWEGGAVLAYKEADGTFRSVTRQILSDAEHGQSTSLRYFEVGSAGHTTLERHEHTHVVIAIRGRGSALRGQQHSRVRIYSNHDEPLQTG